MRRITMVGAVAVLMMMIVGCGEGQANVDEMTGTWEWGAGSSMTFTCSEGSTSDSMSGNINVGEGAAADLVVSTDNCNWNFDMSGSDANLAAGQSCEYDGVLQGQQVTYIENWSSWTMNTTGDSMTMSGNGTLTIEYPNGQSEDCSTSMDGSLTRVSH